MIEAGGKKPVMSNPSAVGVSIIVTCSEQQPQLRQMLPNLLSLQYSGEYEVIVVDESHDKDFEDWLGEVERSHPNLCHTFCPSSIRCIDTHKLAFTLGTKAAAYEWLVFLSADTQLPCNEWLNSLITFCNEQIDIIIGITKRKHLWSKITAKIFRRRFSLFRPTPSIILCRRNILLMTDFHPEKKRIVYHPL